MFTKEFMSLDSDVIANSLKTNGTFVFERGLTTEAIDSIKADVAAAACGFNRNWISGVYADTQYYMSHMLAISRAFSGIVTHPKTFEIADRIIGNTYRLKCHRYYETYGRHRMHWHTDNKTDLEFAQIPGLIFIAYISDVQDGEFQYVRGSHEWSGQKAYNDYSDEFVANNYAKDITSFKGAAGTVIIYNTYGIHRAKPVARSDFTRKSLFWQIDAEIASAEPLLINPEYFGALDERTRQYLGFGSPAGYGIFPNTDLRSLPLGRVDFGMVVRWIGARCKRAVSGLLPAVLKNRIKSALRR